MFGPTFLTSATPPRSDERGLRLNRLTVTLPKDVGAAVLAYAQPRGHSVAVALPVEHLDKVMTELLAVSRSATSKREEAANLARIWGKTRDESARRVGKHASGAA